MTRLAVLLAGVALTVAGSAVAAVPSGNVVVNGNAEQGAAAANASDIMPPPFWTVSPGFTQVAYGSPQFPTTQDGQTIGGGNAFFAGGPRSPTSTGDQSIDVSGSAADIDAGGVTARLSAYLGGFSTQTDQASVDAAFLGAA